MYFYKRFYVLSFILHFHISLSVKNKNLMYTAGLDPVIPYSVGIQFSTQINNTSNDDFNLELNPDLCCLELPDGKDCNVIEMAGCTDFIPRGSSKILKLVAPILDPYERQGFCIVYIDSKPTDGQRIVMRDILKIPFDTRINDNAQNVIKCKEIDEDPQNECKPVDCDTYYNGKRSFFNSRTKKCTRIPKCINRNNPRIIYDSVTNECVKKDSIGTDDLEFIKRLNDGSGRRPKDILIIKNYGRDVDAKNTKIKNDHDTILKYKDIVKPKEKHVDKPKETKTKEKHPSKSLFGPIIKYFTSNKYTLSAFGLIIAIQCCLIFSLSYCTSSSCLCFKKKKVVNKFFNYRQDASVTTPLIYTSNIDTDTTEFPYFSDTSLNVDKKIKCYKACQKERKDNVKMSMSDDILSKCLNRRDWERKPRSETIREDNNTERLQITEIINSDSKKNCDNERRYTETKINYENEGKEDKTREMVRTIVKDIESKCKKDYKKEFSGVQCDLSEKEIECHSYNMGAGMGGSNATGFQPNVQNNAFDMYKTDLSKKGTISVSSEKGAQACFSNDSIDDFLSERGMIFVAESGSKCTFSSSAPGQSSSTSVSSRTSKKNIVKNVFSLFSRKSKQGPSSDSGLKKSKDNLDLELLHISQASIYSSGNKESDYAKSFKKVKDSRTSL